MIVIINKIKTNTLIIKFIINYSKEISILMTKIIIALLTTYKINKKKNIIKLLRQN